MIKMDKEGRWLIGLILGVIIVFGGLFAHIVFIDGPTEIFKEQYIYNRDGPFQFMAYNEESIPYKFTPSFLVKEYNVSEIITEALMFMGYDSECNEWEMENLSEWAWTCRRVYKMKECLKLNDVTRYYITNPIIVTPETLKEYEHMGEACPACEGCSAGNGKVLINYQNNVHYIRYPIIYEKDGRYYIYAESVTEYKNKNDCNTYKEVKMRLYPIYKVDVNTNENCVVYK
jgi:hypothetical protein